MIFSECSSSEVLEFTNLKYPICPSTDLRNRLIVNDYYAIKVKAISNIYEPDEEFDIVLEDGTTIGALCSKPISGTLDFAKLTEKKYIAYLNEVSKDTFLSSDLILNNSYVLIEKQFVDRYFDKLYNSASVWGGFFHNSKSKINSKSLKISRINAKECLKFPTDIHRNTSAKAVLEPFAQERFLKKYHQIELLMDLEIVNSIKFLKKDLQGISNLFSEINSNEINRLKIILRNKVFDFVSLSKSLAFVKKFSIIAENIFQKITKPGNPIGNVVEFQKFMGAPSFEEVDLKEIKKELFGKNYELFLIDLSVYWIYRIRSSIAHQRIGEYILTDKEEDFILGFAEPLIDNILNQIYTFCP